jgi:hypothetical protein
LHGQALCACHAQIDDETHERYRLLRQLADADAPHLKQSGQRRGCANKQPAVAAFKRDTVIPDEPRERQKARLSRLNKPEHQP